MYTCVSVWACACKYSTWGDQRSPSQPSKTRVSCFMNYLKWVLRTKFIFSGRLASSLKLKQLFMPNYYGKKSHWYTYSSHLPCQLIAWVYFERADLVTTLKRAKRTAKCQLSLKFFYIPWVFSLVYYSIHQSCEPYANKNGQNRTA